jgi:hypothetical protein
MSQAQLRALSTLVQSAAVGGYTLPPEVTDAYRLWQHLQQTELPEPQEFSAEAAAHRILEAAAAGEQFDPIALCRDALKVEGARRLHREAADALRIAHDRAAGDAVNTASAATDTIVTEHLRPAYLELLDKAREVATVLAPFTDPTTYQINLQAIVAATSTKVRSAYLELPALVERHLVIRQARDRANAVGARATQRDHQDMFASFQKPLAFHPTWRHPAPVPPLPSPQDPTQRLLWLVSDRAAVAEPWLPTVEEQDYARWAQFGEANEVQRAGRALAEHVSGRAPMSVF